MQPAHQDGVQTFALLRYLVIRYGRNYLSMPKSLKRPLRTNHWITPLRFTLVRRSLVLERSCRGHLSGDLDRGRTAQHYLYSVVPLLLPQFFDPRKKGTDLPTYFCAEPMEFRIENEAKSMMNKRQKLNEKTGTNGSIRFLVQ